MTDGKQVILCGFILCGIITFSGCFYSGGNEMQLFLEKIHENEVADIFIENATEGTIFILNLTHTNLSQYPTFQQALTELYNILQDPLSNRPSLYKQIPKDEYNRIKFELLMKKDGINKYVYLSYYEYYIRYRWYDNAPL
ncbi:MAG: hypothetical protein ACW964_17165 [Candidatus Hodarchaeales archaeon]|jgi:hypothetical protein